jgi:membrane protein YdbS with pleckstrin-like domain
MKKRILVSILILVINFLVFYLIASFMAWELNPANWDFSMRTFVSLFGAIFSLLIIGFNLFNE